MVPGRQQPNGPDRRLARLRQHRQRRHLRVSRRRTLHHADSRLQRPPGWEHPGKISARGGHVWYCEQAGTPAPLDFRVALYEEDGIGGFPSCFGHTLPAAHECGDDLIGDELVHYSTEELLAALPNPGDTLTEGLTFEPCDPICHFEPPKYRVYWRVTRVADAPAAPSVPSAPGNLPGTDGPTTHAPED